MWILPSEDFSVTFVRAFEFSYNLKLFKFIKNSKLLKWLFRIMIKIIRWIHMNSISRTIFHFHHHHHRSHHHHHHHHHQLESTAVNLHLHQSDFSHLLGGTPSESNLYLLLFYGDVEVFVSRDGINHSKSPYLRHSNHPFTNAFNHPTDLNSLMHPSTNSIHLFYQS